MEICSPNFLWRPAVLLAAMVCNLEAQSAPTIFFVTNNPTIIETNLVLKVPVPPQAIWPPLKQSELPNVIAEDPDAPNFLPKVLIMSGKIKEIRTTGYPIEWCGDSFELAVLDSTNYYYKEWRNKSDEKLFHPYGYKIYVIRGDSAAGWGCGKPKWGGALVNCGGGEFGTHTAALMLPARTFWENGVFIGVTQHNQKIAEHGGNDTYEYSDLERFGTYSLPRKMSLTMKLGPPDVLTKEYTVEKIIFSKKPTAEWLSEINEKHAKMANGPTTTPVAEPLELLESNSIWHKPSSHSGNTN